MASASASLTSLLNIMHHVKDHPRHSFHFELDQLYALNTITISLLEFLIICDESLGASKEAAETFWNRIVRAAQAAEDIIESHVVDQIRCGSTLGGSKLFFRLYGEVKLLESTVTPLLHQGMRGFTPDAISCMKGIVNRLAEFNGIFGEGITGRLMIDLHIIEGMNDANIRYCSKDIILICRSFADILGGTTRPRFLLDLQKAIDDMNFVFRKTVNIRRSMAELGAEQRSVADSSTPDLALEENRRMVGFDEQLRRLLRQLTEKPSNRLLVISIVGMGGSGKTTLATNALQHPHIVHHFDVRLSAKISQEFSATKLLSHLLSQLNDKTSSISTDVDELGGKLRKCLYGRRYLIILDDVWGVEAWDELKFYFPNTSNGSCIVVTTRRSDVANYLQNWRFDMRPLNDKNSWDLFCQISFEEQGCCPPELEDTGKKIVANCKGLPLAIGVFAGHLRKSSRTVEYWEYVANDMNSILNSEENEWCLNLLSLSYKYLPLYLKPCFLYLGVLSKDREVPFLDIVKLWIAEGFLLPYSGDKIEDDVFRCIKELTQRNLVSCYSRTKFHGRLVSCRVHDLLREMCLKIAKKEGFLSVLDTRCTTNRVRRVVIEGKIPEVNHQLQIFNVPRSAAPVVRSLICEGGQLSFDLKLLRVLDKVDITSRTQINSQQLNLRYLKVDVLNESHLPISISPSISLIWNLTTLIITRIYGLIIAPYEIWEMLQLRHVEVDQLCLVDPLPIGNIILERNSVLVNLHALSRVENFVLSEEVCRRIPNIESLKLSYGDEPCSYYCFNNLGCFEKLQSLECYFDRNAEWRDSASRITFPNSLRQLRLSGSHLAWEEVTGKVGSLPCLEILELHQDSVIGSEWTLVEERFSSLKSLCIHGCDLIIWNADSVHFPVLERVCLRGLYELDEFPSGMGNIPVLRDIDLFLCSSSSSISVIKMVVEQEEEGHEGIELDVSLDGDEERIEEFKQEVEKEGLKSNNVHLHHLKSDGRLVENVPF